MAVFNFNLCSGNRLLKASVLLLIALLSTSAVAGELDAFERDVIKGEADVYQRDAVKNNQQGAALAGDSCESPGECVFDVVFDIFTDSFLMLGQASMAWVNGEGDLTPRQAGDSLLPIVRLKVIQQNLRSDVSAQKIGLELGYGVLAVVGMKARYKEQQPNDELTLSDIYGLYRVAVSPSAGIGFGLGYQELRGKQHTSGVSITVPIQIKFARQWGVDVQGKWSNLDGSPIESYDVALLRHFSYSSLFLGYETLSAPNKSLHGPYIGLSWQW